MSDAKADFGNAVYAAMIQRARAAILHDPKFAGGGLTPEAMGAAIAAALSPFTEPVAVTCLTSDGYAHGNCAELHVQWSKPGTVLPIGTKLYIQPSLIFSDDKQKDNLREALSDLMNYVGDGTGLMRDEAPKYRGRLLVDRANSAVEYNHCVREAIERAKKALGESE